MKKPGLCLVVPAFFVMYINKNFGIFEVVISF